MANPKKLTALEHLQLLAEQTKKQADTLQENENALSGRIKAIEDAGPEKNVIETVKATKKDITALGIPAQDTTYPLASSTQDGRMSKADKAKLDSIDLADVRMATDDEVKAMLTTVFGS